MKTITLDEFYADPHVIGALLAAGEPAEILCKGDRVWILEPSVQSKEPSVPKPVTKADFKARFLAMHGPDAFKNTRSVEEITGAVRDEWNSQGE